MSRSPMKLDDDMMQLASELDTGSFLAAAFAEGLGQLAPHAGACVSVARALCGGRTVHGLEHYAARNHALARAQPQFLCAASNE